MRLSIHPSTEVMGLILSQEQPLVYQSLVRHAGGEVEKRKGKRGSLIGLLAVVCLPQTAMKLYRVIGVNIKEICINYSGAFCPFS